MQIKTLLKAGTLALDIINHQSTQSLSKLVQNGVQRRVTNNREQRPAVAMTRKAQQQLPTMMTAPLPVEPVKKALKYVTPENIQKAIQWQEIVRSFITKK